MADPKQLGGGERHGEADGRPEQAERHGLSPDEPQHVERLRASEGHSLSSSIRVSWSLRCRAVA